ncbi:MULTISPECIES: phage tail protein [Pseudomonas]|uniref:phage tail protein n=1 Tax=Pseudomonas TaxID=286 RepID=UPI001BE6EBAA|nr:MULTISPECIES: phage tail protein [Pseudomonas]MBT2340631.1 phage tail protein [Pseudomonas fluorescens]MCD4531908.1 phage tail protein [Pseudomonas sp. C3-2018]
MADYYTLLTDAGIAYETACKAAGKPIKLSQLSVGDGGGSVYNPAATATALKREVWRGPLNALFQDENNPSWLLAEVTIPPDVGGWYVREAGIWTDTGILYAIVKYPESFKPVLATSGSGKEFYIRSIFETSNAELVTLLIDDTVVKATRAWVASYVADELAKLDRKQSVRVATTANIVLSGAQAIDGVAVVSGDRVLVKSQTLAKDNGIYVAANGAWARAKDADASVEVTSGLIVSVEEGGTLANTIWQLITDGVIVLGTTALTFQNVTQGFAPLNAPALVNPTATTPAQFDNSTRVQTTAFAKKMGVEWSNFNAVGASTVLGVGSVGGVVSVAAATAANITLPPTGQVVAGAVIMVLSAGAGAVTLLASGADLLTNASGITIPVVLGQGDSALFTRVSGEWRLISGTVALRYSTVMSGPNWTTQPFFDNTKSLATTEFVQREKGGFASSVAIAGGSVALTSAHVGTRIEMSAPGTLTLPKATTVLKGASILITTSAAVGGVFLGLQAGDSLAINNVAVPAPYAMSNGSDILLVSDGVLWRAHASLECLRTSPLFAASFATTGFSKSPGGVIEMWGLTGGLAPSAIGSIVFPQTFPNACLNIQLTYVDSGTQAPATRGGPVQVGTYTKSGFNYSHSGSSSSCQHFWRAIGN